MIFRYRIFAGLVAAAVATTALAADTKISALPSGGQVQTTDQIPVNRAGTTSRVLVGPLATPSTLSAHGLVVGEGSLAPASVAPMALDTFLQGQGATIDPAAVSILNCGDSSHALAYSTSTHTFSCQAIASLATPVTVPNGGTGVTTLASHGVLIGEAAGNIVATTALNTDQLLAGTTGTDPSAVSLVNCGDGTHALAYSTGTHSFSCQAITTVATPVTVANGGTGVGTLTNHGVMLGQGTNAVIVTSALAADTLLQGQGAAADPVGVSVPTCGSSTQALAYSTSTHTFSCQTITGSAAGFTTLVRQGTTGQVTSNTTPTCDGTLTTTIGAGAVKSYRYDALVQFQGSVAAAGWKWGAAQSVTGTGVTFAPWGSEYNTSSSATDAAVNGNTDEFGDPQGAVFAANLKNVTFRVRGVFTTATSGATTVCFAWAQFASNVTATVLVSGSSLTLQLLN